MFDAPPTFPRLPTRQTTNETDIKPAQDETVKTAVATAKPSLAPATLERIQVQRGNSLEHAQSAQEQTIPSSPVSPVSPEPPSTATSLSTLAESIAHGSLPPSANGSSSLLPLSSPPKDANHRARGRKLMLFRMSSTERSQSSSHSSERLDYGGKHSVPRRLLIRLKLILISSVKPCIKRVASGLDFVPIPHHHHKQSRQRPRSPVRRTDPYQAPYFFPSPLSPDAAGYVQRVRLELGGNSPENPSIPLPPASAPPAVIPRNQPIEDVHHEGEAPAPAPHIASDEGVNPDKTVAPQRSRERPVSWNCSSSLHSRPSTSSMERSRMASSPSPSPAKKFWRWVGNHSHHKSDVSDILASEYSRKVIRQGSAPTPLTPHDDRHASPASPSPPASPNTELKRKRTWFRRRHSLSIATLPSPNAHVTEFGELPQDASQRH